MAEEVVPRCESWAPRREAVKGTDLKGFEKEWWAYRELLEDRVAGLFQYCVGWGPMSRRL